MQEESMSRLGIIVTIILIVGILVILGIVLYYYFIRNGGQTGSTGSTGTTANTLTNGDKIQIQDVSTGNYWSVNTPLLFDEPVTLSQSPATYTVIGNNNNFQLGATGQIATFNIYFDPNNSNIGTYTINSSQVFNIITDSNGLNSIGISLSIGPGVPISFIKTINYSDNNGNPTYYLETTNDISTASKYKFFILDD